MKDPAQWLTWFLILVRNVANLLFYTSFYWELPRVCHVFVKWLARQKYLGHAGPSVKTENQDLES